MVTETELYTILVTFNGSKVLTLKPDKIIYKMSQLEVLIQCSNFEVSEPTKDFNILYICMSERTSNKKRHKDMLCQSNFINFHLSDELIADQDMLRKVL
jgi:hypothetical protein